MNSFFVFGIHRLWTRCPDQMNCVHAFVNMKPEKVCRKLFLFAHLVSCCIHFIDPNNAVALRMIQCRFLDCLWSQSSHLRINYQYFSRWKGFRKQYGVLIQCPGYSACACTSCAFREWWENECMRMHKDHTLELDMSIRCLLPMLTQHFSWNSKLMSTPQLSRISTTTWRDIWIAAGAILSMNCK